MRSETHMTRRGALKTSALSVAGLAAGAIAGPAPASKTKVAVVCTESRAKGVAEVLRLLDFPSPKGKEVLLKPNFNTADPAPGSTDNETLRELVSQLRKRGARAITIGERSGPPPTSKVMEEKGIFALAKELDIGVINFEDLQENDWVHLNPTGNHWQNGFWIPKVVAQADYIVSTCCLKTHGFGGVFTMSLKLAVGLTPKRLMRELHGNREHMRRMIAEINLGYRPQVIVMDGVEAFVDGGPAQGKRVTANVFIGGTDRIAVDAVGLAMLKELGSNQAIMGRKIFEQEQIHRAVELGLGISSPEQVELVAPDQAGKELAERLRQRLLAG